MTDEEFKAVERQIYGKAAKETWNFFWIIAVICYFLPLVGIVLLLL